MAVEELDAGPEWLRVAADMPGVSRGELWTAWTDPDELARWWAQEAEIDLRVGGAYHLAWPAMGWHLRGEVTEVSSPDRLAFTWTWDHEPDRPARTVAVDLQALPDDEGTRLMITHGPYGSDKAEQEDRQSHLDGWRHFLERLAALGAEG